jgi:hypothetical protein
MLLRSALVILVSVAWAAPAGAQGRPRPPGHAELYAQEPVIELVTMGIGELIWERHGHIALCVREAGRHRCYSYGVAEFHKPLSMAWAFFRGAKSFWVAEQSPGQMLAVYTRADRTVWVQPLPLSPEQKQQVFA